MKYRGQVITPLSGLPIPDAKTAHYRVVRRAKGMFGSGTVSLKVLREQAGLSQ